MSIRASQEALAVKNLLPMQKTEKMWAQCHGQEEAWQPTSVFLPGESHGQRILADYSPQGHKESDMTEAT